MKSLFLPLVCLFWLFLWIFLLKGTVVFTRLQLVVGLMVSGIVYGGAVVYHRRYLGMGEDIILVVCTIFMYLFFAFGYVTLERKARD